MRILIFLILMVLSGIGFAQTIPSSNSSASVGSSAAGASYPGGNGPTGNIEEQENENNSVDDSAM